MAEFNPLKQLTAAIPGMNDSSYDKIKAVVWNDFTKLVFLIGLIYGVIVKVVLPIQASQQDIGFIKLQIAVLQNNQNDINSLKTATAVLQTQQVQQNTAINQIVNKLNLSISVAQ